MCPSFRATREEAQSPRGRAHLLWEMLQGEVIVDGWRSDEVRDALESCLGCKGCRSDCPTHTDIASYNAEFFSHYYEHKRRPRQAMIMGRIAQWAPLAARFPRLVNALTSAPVLSGLAKKIAGIAAARSLPRFAHRTYRDLVQPHSDGSRVGAKRVILWVDTFNNYFSPGIALAATEVLRRMNFEVVLPKRRLCCGRPLYDFGMLEQAHALLLDILAELGDDIQAGVPVIGLEPGCLSVFKDELLKQLPGHPLAAKLAAQTVLFADFIAQQPVEWPKQTTRVLIHGHCHQKALFGMDAETRLLERMGMQWELLDTGCCGMSGSFGFDARHYATSMKIGEHLLFPAVRSAAPQTVILANGFSCREQIHHGTERHALHICELAQRALPSNVEDPKAKASMLG